jgi:superfamily II DNA or RNA helicase
MVIVRDDHLTHRPRIFRHAGSFCSALRATHYQILSIPSIQLVNRVRVLVLNDEAHHTAIEQGAIPRKWKEFLQDPEYGFKYVVGVSGTCYVGDDYFADVVHRYSLREAMEENFVKRVEYVDELPAAAETLGVEQLSSNLEQRL